MSTLSDWTYTVTLTIWPFTEEDRYGAPTFGAPITIQGDWQDGGEKVITQGGEEIVAKSLYYFELPDGDATMPKEGDFILRGDHTATADPSDVDAEEIKSVTGWNMSMFGDSEIPDWKIAT